MRPGSPRHGAAGPPPDPPPDPPPVLLEVRRRVEALVAGPDDVEGGRTDRWDVPADRRGGVRGGVRGWGNRAVAAGGTVVDVWFDADAGHLRVAATPARGWWDPSGRRGAWHEWRDPDAPGVVDDVVGRFEALLAAARAEAPARPRRAPRRRGDQGGAARPDGRTDHGGAHP